MSRNNINRKKNNNREEIEEEKEIRDEREKKEPEEIQETTEDKEVANNEFGTTPLTNDKVEQEKKESEEIDKEKHNSEIYFKISKLKHENEQIKLKMKNCFDVASLALFDSKLKLNMKKISELNGNLIVDTPPAKGRRKRTNMTFFPKTELYKL